MIVVVGCSVMSAYSYWLVNIYQLESSIMFSNWALCVLSMVLTTWTVPRIYLHWVQTRCHAQRTHPAFTIPPRQKGMITDVIWVNLFLVKYVFEWPVHLYNRLCQSEDSYIKLTVAFERNIFDKVIGWLGNYKKPHTIKTFVNNTSQPPLK